MLDHAWYDAIERRVSRRRFTGEPIDQDVLERLAVHCQSFEPVSFPSANTARVALVKRAPEDLFTGLVGSYGRVVGAPSAGLLVGANDNDLEVGYVGEAFVLEATRLGLDTCWIAGAFSRKRAASLVNLSAEERVPAIVALGVAETGMRNGEQRMRSIVQADARRPLEKLAPGADLTTWPEWARGALDAARRAPSGGNSQPWRFRFENGVLVLRKARTLYWTAAIDLGIAMLHVELGSEHEGVSGTWELPADGPDVARFTPVEPARRG